MKNKKIILLALSLLVVGFISAVTFYQNGVDAKNQKLVTNENGAPFIRDHAPMFGENKNNVIITEFLDPECESCSAFHPVIKEVFTDYKVETKLVIRYLANHENSKFAVRLLEAAKLQNKFNEALSVMFKYQPKWAEHNNTKPELLWELLPEAGLDMVKLKADFNNNNIDELLAIDKKDAMQLGVRGTPTFYVNGKILRELSHKALLDLVESEIYK
jgi:protein-disulfide isomerase